MLTTNSLYHALNAIIKMTDRMIEHAKLNQWDVVATLEDQREEAITRVFDDFEYAAFDEMATELIQQIQRLNEEIIVIGRKAQSAYREEFTALTKGKKIIKLYRDNN